MNLPLFTGSVECSARTHCTACRRKGGSFRRMMARRYAMPEGGPDFKCPHGLPWGYDGKPPPAVAAAAPRPLPERTAGAVLTARTYQHDAHVMAWRLRVRQATCEACASRDNWKDPARTVVYCDRVPASSCAQHCRSLVTGRCPEWERGERGAATAGSTAPHAPAPASATPAMPHTTRAGGRS